MKGINSHPRNIPAIPAGARIIAIGCWDQSRGTNHFESGIIALQKESLLLKHGLLRFKEEAFIVKDEPLIFKNGPMIFKEGPLIFKDAREILQEDRLPDAAEPSIFKDESSIFKAQCFIFKNESTASAAHLFLSPAPPIISASQRNFFTAQ